MLIKHLLPSLTTVSRLHLGIGVVFYAVLLGAVVAFIAGFYEIGFKFLATFWHEQNTLFSGFPIWLLYAIGPFLVGPLLYFIIARIPEKRAHNPADLITGIHIDNGNINAAAALLTAVASAFSIAFGFSVGYYAPTLQLGAGAGALLHKLKWLAPKHAYISIGAGAAAAIAAIFHSPIGAVVFVHEVLFRFFSVRAFAPVTIAAVTAYVISSELFGKVIVFSLPTHSHIDTVTYCIAALAGTFAAIIGHKMIRTILWLQQWNQAQQRGTNAQLLIAAGCTALIIMTVPEAAGSNLYSIQDVLSGSVFTLSALAIIFIAKFCATTVAFGFGIPGGIFGPTIFIGAALGSLIADSITLLYPITSGAEQILIITTMAAMISAVLGAPIAMILITVEMTGNFTTISVVMLAVVMANITAYRLMGSSSFFDIQLKSRGFDFDTGRDRLYAEHTGITELISDSYVALDLDCSPADAEQRIIKAGKTAAYLVDGEGNLRGKVMLVDIKINQQHATTESDITELAHQNPTVLYRNTSIWQAINQMSDSNERCLPIIDGENNPKILGVVYTKPLMQKYFSHLRSLRAQENVSS